MDSFSSTVSPSPSRDALPTDLEVERFVQEMLVFVEARKASVGEQAAIDAFLEQWRERLGAAADDATTHGSSSDLNADSKAADAPVSAVVIPFPLAQAASSE